MTKAEIDAVLERVKTWPPERQEAIASALVDLELAHASTAVHVLSEEERADIQAGRAEADRGEFASDERVRAILSRR